MSKKTKTTKRKTTRKIKVGDWVSLSNGTVHRVHGIDIADNLMLVDRNPFSIHPSLVTKLPASPAVLAKSHRLLVSWCEHGPTDWWDAAIDRHWKKIKPKRAP